MRELEASRRQVSDGSAQVLVATGGVGSGRQGSFPSPSPGHHMGAAGGTARGGAIGFWGEQQQQSHQPQQQQYQEPNQPTATSTAPTATPAWSRLAGQDWGCARSENKNGKAKKYRQKQDPHASGGGEHQPWPPYAGGGGSSRGRRYVTHAGAPKTPTWY